MRAHDIEAVTDEMVRTLRGHADLDWSAPAGDLTWSCRDTAIHVADDLIVYSAQLAAEAETDYLSFGVSVPDDAGPEEVLRVVDAGGALLASTVRTAHPGARGWHPDGVADPGGFAAMGVVEVLLHTHDIARGLGIGFSLPEDTCRTVLTRLFPDVPADPEDAAATLLWATGRGPLDGHGPVGAWRWDSSVRS
ncbi:mycothiol maleylpyruvate isomerase-like protein [Pseudonocardia sediminis]|uniref:Mycothiol maleylpyruvate isomerase-like protein n=1 Tax=Pseudonocardia sediminis TaxID=1397368 RepID=A0A4Q7V550_PSEST|nr:maleylpyruvate isomerase N-terminal domain-containing protein [Pseudonocardia sediminis]RZT87759.1 mycothiol maleylpyruvate isomerase-like protein [Pseudonocardia sediminis]